MNNQYSYLNEHINAYIDGELDNDERARLLFDEQRDAPLAQRTNDAHMLKDKVQLAYSDISMNDTVKKTFSCIAFVSRQRSLVTGLIVLITALALLLPAFINNDKLILAKQLINNTNPVAPETNTAYLS